MIADTFYQKPAAKPDMSKFLLELSVRDDLVSAPLQFYVLTPDRQSYAAVLISRTATWGGLKAAIASIEYAMEYRSRS